MVLLKIIIHMRLLEKLHARETDFANKMLLLTPEALLSHDFSL